MIDGGTSCHAKTVLPSLRSADPRQREPSSVDTPAPGRPMTAATVPGFVASRIPCTTSIPASVPAHGLGYFLAEAPTPRTIRAEAAIGGQRPLATTGRCHRPCRRPRTPMVRFAAFAPRSHRITTSNRRTPSLHSISGRPDQLGRGTSGQGREDAADGLRPVAKRAFRTGRKCRDSLKPGAGVADRHRARRVYVPVQASGLHRCERSR